MRSFFYSFILVLSGLSAPGVSAEVGSAELSSETSLSCTEFRRILSFIDHEHLRLQQISLVEKSKLLKQAKNQVAAALQSMGFFMLAAQFERNLVRQIDETSSQSLCESLQTSMFRAGFIKAYARLLDPYSDFYTPDEIEMKSSVVDGEFTGVGIATKPIDDYLEVTEVVEDGPSHRKLRRGDRVYRIDGHSVLGLNEMEIRQRIRGALGSKVRFSIQRPMENSLQNSGASIGENLEIDLIRDKIHQKSVSFRILKDGILSVKVHKFFRQTSGEIEALLRKYERSTKGIILDLRNNPGGLLQAARDVVDLFVKQGVVVYLKGSFAEDQVWALREGVQTNKPLVVLVNDGTASAAEIVAGALQDYKRAVLIGQKTYGKGSVQNIYDTQTILGTSYKGGLKLTTLWYYLPSGRSVRSLTPDIELPHDANETAIVAAPMPFSGPEKIQVAYDLSPVAKNPIDMKRAQVLLKKQKNTEDAGRALLEMFASF